MNEKEQLITALSVVSCIAVLAICTAVLFYFKGREIKNFVDREFFDMKPRRNISYYESEAIRLREENYRLREEKYTKEKEERDRKHDADMKKLDADKSMLIQLIEKQSCHSK